MAASTATTKPKATKPKADATVTPLSADDGKGYRPFNVKVLTVSNLPKVELRTYDLRKLDLRKLDVRSIDLSKLNKAKFDLPKLKTPEVQLPKQVDELVTKLRAVGTRFSK